MKKIIVWAIALFTTLILLGIASFFFLLSPVSKSNSVVDFEVPKGSSTRIIITSLKDKKLIKSELATLIYSKISKPILKAGTYELKASMNTKEILNTLSSGDSIQNGGINITFVEGKRIPYFVAKISQNFDYTEEEIMNVITSEEYLKDLINKYWFLTDDILNKDIYYPLEGYLYPDTYNFSYESSIKDIFNVILNNTNTKLSSFRSDIENNTMSIHEIMTLASITELEGSRSHDRAGIARVFLNRIKYGMTLGSDVTTYYAAKKDFTSDLTINELNACNAYNTRGSCVKALPAGPICSPGMESIAAAIAPSENDYLYFVADKNGKTYFSKNNAEHIQTIKELKNNGLWYYYN